MKKRFVSILLVAAMTASLAACGGSNGGDNSASATEKGGKTESASDGGEITLTIPTFFVGEMLALYILNLPLRDLMRQTKENIILN